MKKGFFLLLFIFLAFIVILVLKTQCDPLSCVIAHKDFNSFSQKERYENTQDSYRALYENTQRKIRVAIRSGMNADNAQMYIKNRIENVMGLFLNTFAPYPGEISYQTTCGKKFIPTFQTLSYDDTEIQWSPLFYNATLTSGVCSEDQVQYNGFMALIYCKKQKKTIQMEYIAPKDFSEDLSYKNSVEALRCR